ncbi:MAG: DUF664 domain-containing protein [Nocardioides sp.]
MSDATPPWEPPFAGTGDEHLIGALERMRATFRWKADGLDAAGLATTVGASHLTLGGLLMHLAGVERVSLVWKCFGEHPGDPWAGADWEAQPDWEFQRAAEMSPAELYAAYDDAVRFARARLDRALAEPDGLASSAHISDDEGNHPNLRRLIADLVEEYARHTGHADLLREAVDGRVGDDPPWEWRPAYLATGS